MLPLLPLLPKLLKEVLKDIRHDMSDEEVLNLLADSKISVSPESEKEKYNAEDEKICLFCSENKVKLSMRITEIKPGIHYVGVNKPSSCCSIRFKQVEPCVRVTQ